MSNVVQLPRYRKLTGIAPWPIILLAGPEKVGKTWSAVEACMTDLVDGGFWFPIGENDPDEYALIPGFDHDKFTFVANDGTYRDVLAAMDEQLATEKKRTKPTMWVVDSGSRAWDLLSGMAQHEMYQRLARKAAQRNQPPPETEQKPSVDLWNTAADRWSHLMDAMRQHNGPVVITARMELKAVMNDKGEPTRDKEQKILTHKSLPFDVDAIVELQSPGHAVITGVRSVKMAGVGDRREMREFTVDNLLRALGVDQSVGTRNHSAIDPADKPATAAEEARADLAVMCDDNGWDRNDVAAEFTKLYDAEVKTASAKVLREFMALKSTQPAAVAS